MPELFPLEKHNKTKEPENSTLSESDTPVSEVANHKCLTNNTEAVQLYFFQGPGGAPMGPPSPPSTAKGPGDMVSQFSWGPSVPA